MLARRLYRLHLEGQPAAVARRVAEELRIITRTTERCDMLAVLMEVGIRRPLVNRGHCHRRLQLIQF